MATEDLVRSLRARVPWDVARRIFKANELPRSQGWHRTLLRVESGDKAYSEKDGALREALEEHILCGEKLVRVYKLGDRSLDELQQSILGLSVPESAFRTLYPMLLDDNDLKTIHPAGLTLVSIIQHESGVAAVLASTRYLYTRETLSPQDLPDGAAAELSDYSEIIGIKHQRIEALDVLWVPNSGQHIEVRVDYPKGMLQRHGVVAIHNAEEGFSNLIGQNYFSDPTNLFPVINSLYNAKGDGSMVELAFMTSGAAQKHEKMRRDGSCCREEAYHLGGVGALVEPIQPYKASVQWPVQIGTDVQTFPEVSLIGTSLDTASPKPFLTEMVIRDCANCLDYGFVRDRIEKYLIKHSNDIGQHRIGEE